MLTLVACKSGQSEKKTQSAYNRGVNIREEVRAEMKRREITVSELARKSGVSRIALSDWLNARRRPDMKGTRGASEQTINKVLAALGMTFSRSK